MKTYIAYVRVSTTRQVQGASLTEQCAAIERYARSRGLLIKEWRKEVQTAAHSDRSVFRDIMRQLTRKTSTGLILHKIDRGARNLRDWADLADLVDQGIDVRFAHDDLDMETRGGRLSADIQAVIAADYIRNLRDEVRKGIEGRIRQGLYPWPAPLGYRNQGSGRAKIPDPISAPLIIHLFRLFATGEYSIVSLTEIMERHGLTDTKGQRLSSSRVSWILRQPFYTGMCQVRGRRYQGIHQPLITPELFNQVQRLLARRRPWRRSRHVFRYACRLRHVHCGYTLTGERQKSYTYYRCHHCPGVSVREELIDRELAAAGDVETHQFQARGTAIIVRYASPKTLLDFGKFESSMVSAN